LDDKRKSKKIKIAAPIQILDYPITTRSGAQLKKQQEITKPVVTKNISISKKTPLQNSTAPPTEDTSMSDVVGGGGAGEHSSQ
jgi:hypothetical protein